METKLSPGVRAVAEEFGNRQLTYRAESGVKRGTALEALYECRFLRELDPPVLRQVLQSVVASTVEAPKVTG
jgi:hypothetical protein